MNKVNSMNKVMKSVNEKRERFHLEVSLAVTQFELNGGKVTVCKPQKTPKSNKVRAKTKLVFKSKAPVNRPCVMFDNVPLVV